MNDQQTLHRRLADLLRDKLHLDVPSADTDLLETGAIDSLAFAELLLHLEEEFGLAIAVERLEIDDFRSIASIARVLGAQSAGPAASD